MEQDELLNVDDKNEPSKKPSIKKNYFYNLTYQVFLLILPLITTPYISRVLLAEGVGKYSFSFSLITYFTIFAGLGFAYYAQREIAKKQGNAKEQTKSFWEINICRIIPISIALLVNIIFCLVNLYKDYNTLMWILTINIVTVFFDINYFYQGNEKFRSIVIRNVIIKILSIASIFIFVKKPEDLWIYTLINSASLLLSNISMWLSLRKLLVKINFKELRPLRHLKGTLILFLPTIAVSIYTILDKTLIGVLIRDTYTIIDESGEEIIKKYSDLENGYYEQSEKIVKMLMTVITSIGIVMIPRNSNEVARGNFDKVKENIYKTIKFVFLAGIPMVLGMIVVSDSFVSWFFGDGYDKCRILLKILSSLILIIGLSNVFGLQYLIPMGRDKQFTIALIVGAVTNIVLNSIMIIFWWSIGAAISTIIAEMIVTLTMLLMIRKEISVKVIALSIWKYIVAGAIMFVPLFFISKILPIEFYSTIILVASGMVIYGLSLLILREEILMTFIKKFLSKIKKEKNN